MKKTGAWLVRYALEQIGIRHTFGIPGVHNTELYDELNKSAKIQPLLVTHEGGGAFMADAVSRTSELLGTLLIVPAAGVTHAASGIGEAFLDGVPMLVICGGVRTDTGHRYQLHDIDQHTLLDPITKAHFKIESHADILPIIYQAYRIALAGEPGPVVVEVPVNIQLFTGEINALQAFDGLVNAPPVPDTAQIEQAASMLYTAQRPGLFLGWGAVDANRVAIGIAEHLNAPVCTTLQGLSAFPADHPLHTGMSFGPAAVPAAENAFAQCDCLLAVGTRFGEIATGSYGVTPPPSLIHVDINPQVFNANYAAAITLEGDASQVLAALLATMETLGPARKDKDLREKIRADKEAYLAEWLQYDSKDRVNPARFFQALRQQLPRDAIVVADDGNHTFLTAELMPILKPRGFISPTDFNCMGYAVPAVNGAKLANPAATVVGIIGDGAFLMTAMETLTAVSNGLGVIYFVFSDGELSQISQAQEMSYNRKTCSVLGRVQLEGIASATGCDYMAIESDVQCEEIITMALAGAGADKPVIVDVHIDYSKRTRFTRGTVKTTVARMNLASRARIVGRAVWRKLTG